MGDFDPVPIIPYYFQGRTMSVMNGKCEFKITSKQGKPKKSTYDWATQGYVDVERGSTVESLHPTSTSSVIDNESDSINSLIENSIIRNPTSNVSTEFIG